MAATLSEIAKHAGVSVSLVSRLMRDDPSLRISEQRRQEILKITDRLGGVRINRAARSLTKGLAYNFVVPISHQFSVDWTRTNVFGAPLVQNLEAILKEKDFRLSMVFFKPEDRLRSLSDLIASPDYCDGMFLLHGLVDESLAQLLVERKYPHVSVDPTAEAFGVNTVCDHAIGGMRQAISHLRQLGHRRIGFLGTTETCIHRYRHYRAIMGEEGLSIDPGWHCSIPAPVADESDYEWTVRLHEIFRRWLDRGPAATALVAQVDRMALWAVEVLRERGLRVGQDLSIVGYDNLEQRGSAAKGTPILTTVDNPMDQIGRRCGELMINQVLYNQRQIVHESLPVKLIVRESTGPCREYLE